jgi:hypothetical protein
VAFERPEKGNPHNFVIKQHIHTAHAISKFYGDDGKVDVFMIDSGKTKRKYKREKPFYTQRNWDQKTEVGLMAEIEKDFHNEINNIGSVSSRNHHAISKYYLLWRIRHSFHMLRLEDITLNAIPGSGLTKEQEEILEKKGSSYVREGGVVPSRFITGIQMVVEIDRQRPFVKNLKWGLLTAGEGEFIVADCYNEFTFFPVSPKLAFSAGHEDMSISKQSVINTNKQSITEATEFYFARDSSSCPVA